MRLQSARRFAGVILSVFAMGAAATTSIHAQTTAAAPARLTVAILDFETAAGADTGKQISESLAALLTDTPGVQLVDRSSMLKTLQEHELNMTGLVEADKAIQIGKLVGARILITGKAFSLGKTAYITAKVIGTETSLVEGVLVRGKLDDDIGVLVTELAGKLQKRLAESGPNLTAAAAPADMRLTELKTKLAGLKRPRVAVRVREEHHSTARQAIDPAGETELKLMLQQCGFTIVGDDATAQTPDVILSGEAFSEMGNRVGNMVSCSARIELNLINRQDGKILMTDRATARAADLSEQIAGKSALQKAAHELGIKVLTYFAGSLPAEK